MKKGDDDALAHATLLQGILSGDVVAAGMHASQRLYRENARLRNRIGMQRLKTERTKQRLLEMEIEMRRKPPADWPMVMTRIYEIYGLNPAHMKRALPSATVDVIPTQG